MNQKKMIKRFEKRCNPAKRLLAIVLSLAIALTLMPVMLPANEAQAADDPTAAEVLKPTVTDSKVTDAKVLEYAGKQWYVIASGGEGVQIAEGAVTPQTGETTLVLLAKENWSTADFDADSYSNAYGSSKLKTTMYNFVDSAKIGTYYTSEDETWKNGLVATRTLAGGADANNSNYQSEDKISSNDAVMDATLWPLSAKEVSQINNSTILQGNGNWRLRSPGNDASGAACAYSGSLHITSL